MNTYFIRHTTALDITDNDINDLWNCDEIAIHFPHAKNENADDLSKPDSISINPNDYDGSARFSMEVMQELGSQGGYACAQYRGYANYKLGYVDSGTSIYIKDATWGKVWNRSGQTAKLKVLKLRAYP